MGVSAFEALAAAEAAGVRLTLDGDGIILEAETPPLPGDVVELLRSVKPDLLRILECRAAAEAALGAEMPPDCRPWRWVVAQDGLRSFVDNGWGDKAALMGWTAEELYRVPRLWSQVHLTGAGLLIGDRRVIAVTEASIVVETRTGSQLKFRRIGREHVA
jgi:hypothetical protein